MPNLIVTTQGARLRCAKNQLLVEDEDGARLHSLPEQQVEGVTLLGRVGMSTGFLQLAFEQQFPVTFLTAHGGYRGRLQTGQSGDVRLRVRQYRRLDDLPWRLAAARAIVLAKLRSERSLLLRQDRNHPQPALREAAAELARLAGEVPEAKTLPALMGREGRAARCYFAGLRAAVRRPLPFRGRSRRPPRDPVNSLLSLSYSLLTTELAGALQAEGLSARIGAYHSPRRRVPALALDLLEPFRAPVADRLTLTLVNRGQLRPEHFVTEDDGGVRLTREGLRTYFTEYARRLERPFHNREGRRTCFRQELWNQARGWQRFLEGQAEFRPFQAEGGGPDRRQGRRKS